MLLLAQDNIIAPANLHHRADSCDHRSQVYPILLANPDPPGDGVADVAAGHEIGLLDSVTVFKVVGNGVPAPARFLGNEVHEVVYVEHVP